MNDQTINEYIFEFNNPQHNQREHSQNDESTSSYQLDCMASSPAQFQIPQSISKCKYTNNNSNSNSYSNSNSADHGLSSTADDTCDSSSGSQSTHNMHERDEQVPSTVSASQSTQLELPYVNLLRIDETFDHSKISDEIRKPFTMRGTFAYYNTKRLFGFLNTIYGSQIMFHKRHLKNMVWMVRNLIEMNQTVSVEAEWVAGSMRVVNMHLDDIRVLRKELAAHGIRKLKKTEVKK